LAQVLGGTSSQFVKGDGSLDSTTYQNTADKGQPNGYASLDGNGKVPLTQINDALIGNVNFQGLWNASTNTPTLVDPPSSGTKGYYYIVSTGGTFAGITFEVGDWIISNGTAWGKVDNTDAVSSVFGRTGNVTASNGDYNTSQVTESGNLYYTDARSRAALSFAAGSGAYNSGTGVITIPTNNNQITNGAGYITSAALGGYVQGSGTTNTVAKFTSATTIGNSNITDSGSLIQLLSSTQVTDSLYVKSSVYPSAYFTSLRSDASANGILQLGNNNDNYILGGNTAAGGYLIFRVNVTSESIASGVESLRLNSNATASFSSRVNVNGAADDADIALQTVAPSGAGKYIYVGRDSSAQWRFSVHSSGDTQIGAPQAGASYKLLTLSSNGNNLDTGTVLRLIGNSALDLVDISVRDTTTRIYHQENAPDAANGYGKIQFRTNATANGSFPTRGGFQFTIGSTDALFINSTGAATFSSSVTVGTIAALTPSFFGYSSSYPTLIVGPTGNSIYKTLTFGVDVSGNPSGAFSGSGSEYVWRNTASFITPNAINNGFTTLLGWNSSGQITFSQASLFASSLQVNSSFQIGDYTQGTNNLTFAASANGIAKINFYDSNNTEGLYIRTDGESQGGTMTFGARWDDDEAKIVFKMYQVSAGGPYNARVGIGTGALSPLSMLHVCETDGGNYTGTFRVGGTTGFGIVSEYTQSAATTGTMYVSPGYSNSDVLFKLGAGSGNSNQLVLRGNGNVGLNVASPSSLLTLRPPTVTTESTIEFTNSDNAAITSYYNMTFAVNNTNTVAGRAIVFASGGKGYGNQVKTMMAIDADSGNVSIGSPSVPGRLTAKYTSYSSGQTPLYIGNTGFTNWNRQSYDTFVLQQDDVTSFRMVEKNGEATGSDQVLTFSIGDNLGVIATSAQPLGFYVNGSPSGLAYQGLSGTQVLRLQTNGSANFYGALTVAGTVSTTGNYVASNSGIAEIRLQGGGYGGGYNTSLRSIVGAPGVLQFGNNGINYVLGGNTLAGGYLVFRVNCNSESVSSGSLALTLNANATALFASSVTATAFFESSDKRLKSNIINLDIDAGSIAAKHYTKNGVEEIGYLAQDVEAILPSAISKREDGYLDLSYRQVHTAKIAALEKELAELKKQLKNK
jgi:hypothetical protein